MFFAEKFQCPNKEDHVYFRFGEKLELQHEFDTLLVGSLENGKILKSKRYGQGFLEYGDDFKGETNWDIELPGFNDAVYNWETFESNTFFLLFTTDSSDTKYGFDLRLTCQKPITVKGMFKRNQCDV